MATIKRFEEIFSWQRARELNKKIGALIDGGRFKKNYKLIDQIERSAGSIMDNISEGFERSGNKEFIQFLLYQKVLPVNSNLNYKEQSIEIILTRMNSINC